MDCIGSRINSRNLDFASYWRQLGYCFRYFCTDGSIQFRSLYPNGIPIESEEASSSWHIYPLRIAFDDIGTPRKLAVEELRKRGIGTQVHYYPIPLQPYYRAKWGYTEKDFPEAVKHYSQALTLPLFPAMSDKDVELVISSVREILRR